MNIVCVDKPPVLFMDCPKWHEHTLALFPRKASLTCDLCALTHSNCPFYICPQCDFVAHHSCISLHRVIKISRHHHRLSYTSSFTKEIGLVVFVAERSTMITGVILAKRTVVPMWLIRNVPYKKMCGMERNFYHTKRLQRE